MRSGARRFSIGLIAIVVAVAVGALYISQARESDPSAVQKAQAPSNPRLRIVTVAEGPKLRDVTLLADVKPYASSTMYGKTGGYLKSIAVDRGDHVTAGQVIAEIESAETDHQYASALADLENKKKLATRAREMAVTGTASKQTRDNANTTLQMAEAAVRQLASLKSYEILRAPFDGTVTTRFVDPGALISNASTNQSNALPVLTIMDNSKLRVATYVEQSDAVAVQVGTPVEVIDSTNPDRKVAATVSRTAGSLDQKTRTLYIEVDVDNSNNFLAPGSFAHVTLHLPVQSYPQVPAASLVTRNDADTIAYLDEQNQVHFRPVQVASTVGALVNLSSGVQVGERVVLNPPEEVAEGTKIDPIVASAPVR